MWQAFKKRLYKSKTYLLNHAVAIIGIAEVNFHLLQNALKDNYGYAFIAVAVVGYIVREMTKAPVSEK